VELAWGGGNHVFVKKGNADLIPREGKRGEKSESPNFAFKVPLMGRGKGGKWTSLREVGGDI